MPIMHVLTSHAVAYIFVTRQMEREGVHVALSTSMVSTSMVSDGVLSHICLAMNLSLQPKKFSDTWDV